MCRTCGDGEKKKDLVFFRHFPVILAIVATAAKAPSVILSWKEKPRGSLDPRLILNFAVN